MLQIGISTTKVKATPYKRYKVTITAYDKNGYYETEVFDKQENKIVYKTANKKDFVILKKEVIKKYGQLKIDIITVRLYEEYLLTPAKEKELITVSSPKTEFALFVKEVTRLLIDYKYTNFKPEFKRVDEKLNVNLIDTEENTTYSRIEKDGDWYKYYYNDKVEIKARLLDTIFKR